MAQTMTDHDDGASGLLPGWMPAEVRLYLDHIAQGVPIRELARREGLHASTVLRRVRRFEARRDDPLIDAALGALDTTAAAGADTNRKDRSPMTAFARPAALVPDDAMVLHEARRILRRLCEPGAILAIAPDLDRAAVIREMPDGSSARTAVTDRAVAQAFALRDWIACRRPGRVAAYAITGPGRAALRRMLGGGPEDDALAEAPTPFADQHRNTATRTVREPGEAPRRVRVVLSETPVAVLARRREKDGAPFLSADLVAAADRLYEDFELAQTGPRVAQNWDRFLTAGVDAGLSAGGPPGLGGGPAAARERVAAALRDLGPGLGDVALRVCCLHEGVEATERRLGWSARSGKIVLRIALTRLKRHYDETYRGARPLIG
jgi:hypothetical protein